MLWRLPAATFLRHASQVAGAASLDLSAYSLLENLQSISKCSWISVTVYTHSFSLSSTQRSRRRVISEKVSSAKAISAALATQRTCR
jgi:hypothetical protein